MNSKGRKGIILVFTLLISIVLTSVVSFADTVEMEDKDSKSNVLKMRINDNFLHPNTFSKSSFKAMDQTNASNIVVANESINEYYPSIVVSGSNVLVAYESYNGNDKNVFVKHSNDYGQTWLGPNAWTPDQGLSFISPSLSIVPYTKQAFGSFISTFNDSGEFYVVDFANIYNDASWNAYPIDWSEYEFYGFEKPDIISYPNGNYPWVAALIGSTDYEDEATGEGPCVDSPMFCFVSTDAPHDSYTIYWEPSFESCSNISIHMDYENSQTVYGVCEIKNGTNQDILFFKGTPEGWNNDEELYNYTFTGSENLLHPEILVKEDEIYVVMETDDGGESEIILYKSVNGGEDWTLENITGDIFESDEEPAYPRIFMNSSHLICSFIESGDLSYTSSNDKGANWTEPYQLNDVNGSVEPGYHFSDIGGSQRFIWTDNREGNLDIYYYLSYLPQVDLVLIDVNVTGDLNPLLTNNLISITVTNNGDALVKDVKINVTLMLSDGNTTSPDYPYVIPHLAPGQTVTINRPLFRFKMPEFLYVFIEFAGIENISVTVDPDHEFDDTNRGNNEGIYKIDYEELFPRMAQYEEFLILLRKLFF
jgi:hypothetical protein